MAVVKTGAAIADIRGKIGGSVFQGSQGGLVLRNNTTPVNPSSQLQVANRSLYFRLQVEWSNILTAQRIQWDQWAQYQNNNQGRFTTSFQSGQVAFIQCNFYRIISNQTILSSPVFAPLDVFADLGSVTFDSGTETLVFACSSDVAESDIRPIFRASFIEKETRSHPAGGLKQIVPGVYTSFDYDVSDTYLAAFGRFPAVDDIIFVSTLWQSTTNGALSLVTQKKYTVVAP